MVTAGVRSTGLLALTAASGEIHNAWATFGRVTGAKEAEPNFRMTDNLPFAYLRSTLRRYTRVRLKPSLRTMHTTNYFSGHFHPASREIKQERRST